MRLNLTTAIYVAGLGQLSVLVASALVPIRLDWKSKLAPLPKLVRQLYWIYGGYVVMAIFALGTISILNAEELAGGTRLARSFCAFGALFWGVRLSLQPFLAAHPHLTTWWLRAGYHLLTIWFASFVLVYGWAMLH